MSDSIEEYGDTQVRHACEELFERGVHCALSRMARFAPDTLADMWSKLMESLDDPDPVIRGHANEVPGLLRDDRIISLTCR